MKRVITAVAALGLLTAGAVQAQTAPTPTTRPPMTPAPTIQTQTTPAAPRTSAAPAAVSNSANPGTTQAPVPGANSFTEGQARARIQDLGFGNVTDLKKDDQGIWRGTAMKDGKSVPVALDYQGNVQSH